MPPELPQINFQWSDRWKRLDELAGCVNEWSFGTGNPCASDVPIFWAKKGIEMGSDEEWLNKFGIENTRSTCLQRPAGGGNSSCSQWIESKGGCWREEAQLCTCRSGVGGPGPGCSEWDCIAKDMHHQQCWEADWSEAFNTECGPPGFAPWPLGREIGINYTEFRTIFDAEGTSSAVGASYDSAVDVLLQKQSSNWYKYGVHCIAQKTVGDKANMMPPASACQTWRQISSKAQKCKCLPGSSQCQRWQCQGSTLSASEVQTFECLEYSGSSCIRWSAEIEGPMAQLGECRACTSVQDCLFVCRLISMHRIVEFPVFVFSSWGLRLGHAILHLIWLLPVALMFGFCLAEFQDDDPCGTYVFQMCIAAFGMAIMATFAWLVAFYRNVKDAGSVPPLPRWESRAPADPVAGLFFTFGTALLCGYIARVPLPKNKGRALGPVFVVPMVVMFWCFLWSCGFAAAWFPLFMLIGYAAVMVWACTKS